MRKLSSKASMPYPELVLGEGGAHYRVFDTLRMPWLPTNGMTDKKRARIYTPFHPDYRHVSRHELSHVKWSPERMPKLDFDVRVYLAVEDARINMGLERLGKPLELSSADRDYVAELVQLDLACGDTGAVVLRAIAGIGTNADGDCAKTAGDSECSALAHALTRVVRRRLLAGVARRRAPVASQRLAIKVARDVARVLERRGDLPHGTPGENVIGCVFGACAHGGEDGILTRHGTPWRGADFGGGDEVEPGDLEITEPRLAMRVANRNGRGARAWKPAVEGSVVLYAHRSALDGAVYRRAVRRGGCTVLIDASGSMSLSSQDLSHILAAAPGKPLVGIYGGDGDSGELRIVARGGYRAPDSALEAPGVGNIVDIPCLEWLASQRGPRIWVSDGGVTGKGDRGGPNLRDQAEQICRRARIQRVRTASDAVKHLRNAS
jgi:hypothetical protein